MKKLLVKLKSGTTFEVDNVSPNQANAFMNLHCRSVTCGGCSVRNRCSDVRSNGVNTSFAGVRIIEDITDRSTNVGEKVIKAGEAVTVHSLKHYSIEELQSEIESRAWTYDKFIACKEIKWGCSFSNKRYTNEDTFVAGRVDEGFKFLSKNEVESGDHDQDVVNNYNGTGQDWHSFKFFRKDGTEILPPKE